MKNILCRFKSWATWVAVAGAVWVLLSAFGVPEKLGVTADGWSAALDVLGSMLTLFGIVNNPTDRENF